MNKKERRLVKEGLSEVIASLSAKNKEKHLIKALTLLQEALG